MPHGVSIERYLDIARAHVCGIGQDRGLFHLAIEAEVTDRFAASADFVCRVVHHDGDYDGRNKNGPHLVLCHFNAITYAANLDSNEKARFAAEDFLRAEQVDPFDGAVTMIVLSEGLLRALLPHAVKVVGPVESIAALDEGRTTT